MLEKISRGCLDFGHCQKGQSLLIVVLVMVVALTVGLSVASRSIINLRTSKEEENSQRAFSAAEAGVEQALKVGCVTPTPPGTGCVSIANSFPENSSSFTTSIISVAGDEFIINGGNQVEMDQGTDIWLIPHNTDGTADYTNPNWTGTLSFYWGNPGDACSSAALEVALITGTRNSPSTARFAADPCTARRSINNFSQPLAGDTIGGRSFAYKMDISVTSPGILARVVPIYYSSSIAVSGNGLALPSQGDIIESTGVSGSTNRKITFYKGYLEIPTEFFPFIFFSTK